MPTSPIPARPLFAEPTFGTRRNRTSLRAAALAIALVAAVAPVRALAARIEGVEFAERVDLGDTELALHGLALLRYRVIFKGYVAALYLEPAVSAEEVLSDVPRRLEIEYFWSIPATGFVRATFEGIEKNVDPATWRALQPRVERFSRLYADVGPGDRYQLTYLPGRGTELSLNGRPRGVIEGADFAAALFSIWLGQEPFDESLKEQLLEGTAAARQTRVAPACPQGESGAKGAECSPGT